MEDEATTKYKGITRTKQKAFDNEKVNCEIDTILHENLPSTSRLKPPNYKKKIKAEEEKEFLDGYSSENDKSKIKFQAVDNSKADMDEDDKICK